MSQGLQRIPLFVDSDFQYQPVRANFPEPQAPPEIKFISFEPDAPPASPEPEAPEERSTGDVVTDTGAQLAEGVNTVLGAVPNLVAPEGKVAGFFNDNAQFWRDKQSDSLKAKIARADQAITRAGEDGMLSQIAEAASQYFTDPALAARFVTTNLPSMIPGIAAAKIAQAAALAKGASAARAVQIATTASGASNAALNAGGARGEAFEDIKRTLIQQGLSPELAEQQAIADSRIVAAVGGIAGYLSGKTGLEKSLIGQGATKGAIKSRLGAAAAELAGEQVEEVTPQIATNIQAGQYDGRSAGKDVGRTIVETAIGAGPGAVVAGGMHTAERPAGSSSGDENQADYTPDVMAGTADHPAGQVVTTEQQSVPTLDQAALPFYPLEGEVIAQDALPSGQARLAQPAIEGEYTTMAGNLPRLALPAPADGGPTVRELAAARGLLNHHSKPSPELLMRALGYDADMAARLYARWLETDKIQSKIQSGDQGNGANAAESADASMDTQGATEWRGELPGSGGVLAPAPAGDRRSVVSGDEVAASGVRPAMAVGDAGAASLNNEQQEINDGSAPAQTEQATTQGQEQQQASVDAPPTANVTRSYLKAQAAALASRMTKQGLPSEVFPHPSGDGTYAIKPAESEPQAAEKSRREPTGLESRVASQSVYNDTHGLPNEQPINRTIDGEELASLRRSAAGLERPESGVFLRIEADGRAVATGPKGTRIPDAFRRFAHDNDLAFYAERRVPKAPDTNHGEGSGAANAQHRITRNSAPMPIAYRASGAHYFGEDVGQPNDRTDKTKFSLSATDERQPYSFMLQPIRDIQGVVDKFKAAFKGADALNIRVVASVDDIPAQFRPSPFAEGVFHDDVGLIYLIADGMLMKGGKANTQRAFQVLMHETVGHFGLAAMMGERFNGLLKHVMRVARDTRVTDDIYGPGDQQYATVEAVRLRYPEASDTEIAQEVMARMAESDSASTRFGYIRAVVRQWLRDMARAMGFDISVTTEELNDLIAKASQYLRSGKNLETVTEPTGLVAASQGQGNDQKSVDNSIEEITLEARNLTEEEINDAETQFLSDAPAGASIYRRGAALLKRVRQASEEISNELGGEAERRRVQESTLGAFTGYEVSGEEIAPDEIFNPDGALKVYVFGNEQIANKLTDEPALTFTVMPDGEMMVNGPFPDGPTFKEFQKRGWATQAKDGAGKDAAGWSALVDPAHPNKRLQVSQVLPLLADVHARVRAWRMEDHVGLHWSRATGALGGIGGDSAETFVYFSKSKNKRSGLESRRHVAGDSGRQYSADQQQTFRNIGREVETPTVREWIDSRLQGIGMKLRQGVADQFAPLKDIDQNAYLLARMSKAADGALEAMLMYGRVFLNGGIYDVDIKDGGIIDKLLHPLGAEADDFMWWVAGNRADALARESAATRAEGARLLNQAHVLDSQAKQAESEAKQILQQAGNLSRGMLGNLRAQKANTQQADELMREAKRLRRAASEARERGNPMKDVSRENLMTADDIANLKALGTGNLKFDYPLSNGQKTRDRATAYADANKTLQSFNKSVLDIAEQSGLIDGAERAIWERDFYVPFYREAEEGEKKFPSVKKGLVRQKAFERLKGGTDKLNHDLLANTLMNWSHMLNASAKNRAAKAALTAAERVGAASVVPAGEKGAVSFRDGGQEIHYQVTDPFILDAVSAIEFSGFSGPAMKAMGAFKRWLTMGVTANPAFKIRNLIRDSISAIGQGELSYNPYKNLKQGYKGTDKKSQTYASMLAGGGIIRFGTMIEGNRADHVRRLVEAGIDPGTIIDSESKLQAVWKRYVMPAVDAYNELGDRSEGMNRAALYEQLRANGMGHAEANFAARDLLDFSMGGTSSAIRFLTQVVPFANARIQGLYKLGRAAKENPKRMSYVVGAVALASLVLLTAYHDDDDWKKREDWDRDTYWWFKIGDVAFRIPKPFEIGSIGTLAERSAELLFDKEMDGQRFGKRLEQMVSSTFAMNPVPQMFKPLLDLYANTDSFTGRAIETMGMEKMSAEDRYTARTSEIAKMVGKAGVLSPVQIDHLIRGYFGWLGTAATTTVDQIVRAGDANQRPSLRLRDTFLIGNFVETLPTGSSRYVTQMYEQSKAIEEAYNSWRHYLKLGDTDKATRVFADKKSDIALYRKMQAVKRAEASLNAQAQRIEADKKKSGKQKREELDRLAEQKDKLARLVTAAGLQ